MKKINSAKADYQRLRLLSCEELWAEDVPAFDGGDARVRMARVGVVRAVGVVFSERGTSAQKAVARVWLRGLLQDPEEKIRRYAMTALPKIGAGAEDEQALLTLIKAPATDREKKSLNSTLEKIGGAATLEAVSDLPPDARQKLAANVARQADRGAIDLQRPLSAWAGVRIRLHCRRGLEDLLADEVDLVLVAGKKIRRVECWPGGVGLEATAAFCLSDLFAVRCFHTLGFVAEGRPAGSDPRAVAAALASLLVGQILRTFTRGAIRYRLEFGGRGPSKTAVREVADRVHALCPDFLNDPREALWQIMVSSHGGVELRPRFRPDPRFAYRRRDVPAASHPPLAAAMVQLAGGCENESVWDPFCGSGLELIERALKGGVFRLLGSDRSEEATVIARDNLLAALTDPPRFEFQVADFRDFRSFLKSGEISLILTNPPMGRRVPIPDLPELMADLFRVAAEVLRPGGRLVLANPRSEVPVPRSLKRVIRQKIDLGGFDVQLEKYVKLG